MEIICISYKKRIKIAPRAPLRLSAVDLFRLMIHKTGAIQPETSSEVRPKASQAVVGSN